MDLDEDSIMALMQEIYNELVEQRNIAVKIQNQMYRMLKTPEDMQLIGPVIEKQQKIINDVAEKKLAMVKIQAQMRQKAKETGAGKTKKMDFSSMDMETLMSMYESSKGKEGPAKETYDGSNPRE